MIEPKLKEVLELGYVDFIGRYNELIEISKKSKSEKDYLLEPGVREEIEVVARETNRSYKIEQKDNIFELKDLYGQEAEFTTQIIAEKGHVRFHTKIHLIYNNQDLKLSTGYWDDIYKELTGKEPEPIRITSSSQLKKIIGRQVNTHNRIKSRTRRIYDIYSEYKKRFYKLEPKLKTALENINFANRYESLLNLHKTEDAVSDIPLSNRPRPVIRKEVGFILDDMNIEYEADKRENFFRVKESHNKDTYIFTNIIVDCGFLQLFSAVCVNDEGIAFGGNTWDGLYNLLKFGDIEGKSKNNGRYPKPQFTNRKQLERIIEEVLSIQRDFSEEMLKVYSIEPKPKK